MGTWRFTAVAGLLVALLAPDSGARDFDRIGGRLLLGYNLPVMGLRNNWYTQAVRWGGSVVYNRNANNALEFEYHRLHYKDGKIESQTFTWNEDSKDYASPRSDASMRINSVLCNVVFRLGDKSRLFNNQATSPYVVAGGGFHSYSNRVSGLIYPGQKGIPVAGSDQNRLDPSVVLEPVVESRWALGAHFGFGVERFMTNNISLDFRAQHNFLVGTLGPREAWGIKGVMPLLQMLDLEVAVKFYESGRK
ncbi:MAG: hypothetical protein OXR72_20800 [Gemmatimonadota bacterium]|nr:hypothetical protein [Gemmatimonadota bacterium]